MNFLGHTHVALAGGEDDPGFVLGAVLPDLAPMAGIRVPQLRPEGPLGAGVRCLLRADAAWRAELRATTVAELVGVAVKDAPPAALQKALRWIAATVRAT